MQVVKTRHHVKTLLLLLFWLGFLGLFYTQQQRLIDWWKLRGYKPPAVVASIASDDTMSNYAKHLFYVNKPTITSSATFTRNCPQGSEKTVVLGCYRSGDEGIYLYEVSDSRLHGVVQVTAAHEMLHAAYDRLSTSERQRVDAMLNEYYQHSLSDERVKQTIAAYKLSEPRELANEMHSIFATEISDLPANLETYYKQYFSDRKKLAGYTTAYQAEFTSRQNQLAAYDAQLAQQKQAVASAQQTLQQMRDRLNSELDRMNARKAAGDTTGYNALVAPYNQMVNEYNLELAQTRRDIESYNALVDTRNSVALEERQLVQAISAKSLPAAP